MFRDGPRDAVVGELRDILGGVRGVIKFARDLMKFDFQQHPVRETEMFIAQAVQLRVKQGTEFPRIGRGGDRDAHRRNWAREPEG
jgi:hypothetical protein